MRKGWTPERIQRQREVMKQLNADKEFREKSAEGRRRFIRSEEGRRISREKFSSPAFREKNIEGIKWRFAQYRGGYLDLFPPDMQELYQKLRLEVGAPSAYKMIVELIKKNSRR